MTGILAELSSKLIGYVIVTIVALCVGWKVCDWKNDSQNAAIERAAQAITDKSIAKESGIAAQVEAKLGTLKANQTIIDRGVIREIQNTVYQRVCFEPDGVRLFNAAARGEAAPVPAKPAGQVPGNPAGNR